MNIRALIRNAATKATTALVCLLALTSCNGLIYNDEGDCTVYYRLKFRYDMNLKRADAFASEVTSVHLYAFDTSGVLVLEQDETVAPAEAENYTMLLGLPAGDYHLLAWCGLSNDGERDESFSVPDVVVGQTRLEELQCTLARMRDEAGAHSKDRLYRLFHGAMDVNLPKDDLGGSYEYTMRLTKDTNHIRIILQHLSADDVDVNKFAFRIEDENGLMAHDNELMDDEIITYHPWKMQNAEAGVEPGGSRAVVSTKSLIADFTVARMMEAHRRQMYLTITNPEGHTVARVPVIDYALLAKDYYEEEYEYRMTEQELLDREDDYVMTFFLDEDREWISAEIYIHSWRVVTGDYVVD